MYCSTPTNADVTGIGVRGSMYAQAFLTVVLGYISWSRNRDSTPAILAAARLQTYTLTAFAIATFAETIRGQLSLFHQFAAVQLAILSYGSGVFAAVFWGYGHVKWLTITWSMAAWGMVVVAFLIFFLWSEVDPGCSLVIASYEGCRPPTAICNPSPDSPHLGYQQLTWVFLFGVHLKGKFVFPTVPFAIVSGGILIAGAFYLGPRKRLLFAYFVFWLHTVLGIEFSLSANSIDLQEENGWTFGQIIPILLLLPTLESIVAEYRRYDKSEDTLHRIPLLVITEPKDSAVAPDGRPCGVSATLPPGLSTFSSITQPSTP